MAGKPWRHPRLQKREAPDWKPEMVRPSDPPPNTFKVPPKLCHQQGNAHSKRSLLRSVSQFQTIISIHKDCMGGSGSGGTRL